MAGVITSGNFPKALQEGIKGWYERAYDEFSPEFPEIFEMDDSAKQYEEFVGVSGFGLAPVKPEGQGVTYDDMEQNFVSRFVHKVYGKGFIVTEEALEDNLYNLFRDRARELAFAMRQTKETVAANILNRAFDSSYTMGSDHDGKELLATDHPAGPYGGTYQNELSTAADLSEDSLEDLIILIHKATNPRGLKIRLMPQKLIVPPDLVFVAERILKSPQQPGTANNDINAIQKGNYLPQGFVVNHYLTDADAWFVKTNAPKGMTCLQRRAMSFGPDNDFDTGNGKFKATERYSFGWVDPRGLYGSAGA